MAVIVKEAKTKGFFLVGNCKTEFKRDAIKKMTFPEFKAQFEPHGIVNLVTIYEALTGKKVGKAKATPASKRKK